MTQRPLQGLTVIALEQAVAAPSCTLALADAGARVIKVERPGGETARHYDATVDGISSYFVWLNRGKESAVLDLKTPQDLALMRRMLARADVFVQNLAPGATARMGLVDADLAAANPRLIRVSITGYGQDTAFADMRAYDMLVQAESGVCAVTGTPETPSKTGVPIADIATGMSARSLILEALIARGISGRGQHIEVAMFDVMAHWMSVPLLHHEHAAKATGRHGLSHATIYPYRPFRCADGREVIVGVQTAEEWDRLCTLVLERPDLARDPRFATNARRDEQRAILDATIEPVFAGLSETEAIARLSAGRIAWARVNDVAALSVHPALRRGQVELPSGAPVSVPAPPGGAPHGPPATAPALGAHTAALRAEFAN